MKKRTFYLLLLSSIFSCSEEKKPFPKANTSNQEEKTKDLTMENKTSTTNPTTVKEEERIFIPLKMEDKTILYKNIMVCNEEEKPFKGDCQIQESWVIKNLLPALIQTELRYQRGCNDHYFLPAITNDNFQISFWETGENTIKILHRGNLKIIDSNKENTRRANFVSYCNAQINAIEHELLEESTYLFENLVQELEEFSKIKNILPSLQSSWKNFTEETKKNSLSQYSLKTNLEAWITQMANLAQFIEKIPTQDEERKEKKDHAQKSYHETLSKTEEIISLISAQDEKLSKHLNLFITFVENNRFEKEMDSIYAKISSDLELLIEMKIPRDEDTISSWKNRIQKSAYSKPVL